MTRTKSIIGALALCALAVCAFAAASASASELTAVTCKEVASGAYNNSHCETPKAPGKFETEAIPVGTTTSVDGTSVGEPILRATIGGLNVTVMCESGKIEGGSVKNEEPSAGKHKISSTATRDTYEGCETVLKANEARWCKVEEVTGPTPGTIGMISTVALKSETTGVEHKVKVSPSAGEVFTKFNVLNKTKGGNECPFGTDVAVEVKGSVEGEASTTKHSHLTFTEANNGAGLTVGGNPAKYIDTVIGNMAGEPGTTVGAETFT
jgi:hypothetical protein